MTCLQSGLGLFHVIASPLASTWGKKGFLSFCLMQFDFQSDCSLRLQKAFLMTFKTHVDGSSNGFVCPVLPVCLCAVRSWCCQTDFCTATEAAVRTMFNFLSYQQGVDQKQSPVSPGIKGPGWSWPLPEVPRIPPLDHGSEGKPDRERSVSGRCTTWRSREDDHGPWQVRPLN